jgi:hypothetical protein
MQNTTFQSNKSAVSCRHASKCLLISFTLTFLAHTGHGFSSSKKSIQPVKLISGKSSSSSMIVDTNCKKYIISVKNSEIWLKLNIYRRQQLLYSPFATAFHSRLWHLRYFQLVFLRLLLCEF